MELIVVVLPISVSSYIPHFFFELLLVLTSVDLMYEWLIATRHNRMISEYVVCQMSFVAIQCFGLDIGMFLGIILAMISSVVMYAKLTAINVTALTSSTVARTFEERAVLLACHGKIVTIALKAISFLDLP